MLKNRLFFFLIGLISAIYFPQKINADTPEFQKNIRIIQQNPFMRKYRFEISPTLGFPLNETLTDHWLTGITMNFYLTNDLSIGGSYLKYNGSMSGTGKQVGDNFEVYPEVRLIKYYAGGHVSYVPIYGKFLLAQSMIVHFDFYVTAGAGVINTGWDKNHPVYFSGGIGSRIFVTDWLCLMFEFRDHVYEEDYLEETSILNNIIFQGGLSFFIPFKYSYQYQR
jgi:outer membrane beta-barrel protein